MTTDSVNYRSVCLYATDLRKLNIRGWGKFFLHSLQATHSIDIIHWLCLFCFDPNGRQCYPLRIINPLYAVSMFIWCQRKDSRVHMGWNILKAPQKPVISVSFLTFALGNRMLVSLVCHNGRQAAKKKWCHPWIHFWWHSWGWYCNDFQTFVRQKSMEAHKFTLE